MNWAVKESLNSFKELMFPSMMALNHILEFPLRFNMSSFHPSIYILSMFVHISCYVILVHLWGLFKGSGSGYRGSVLRTGWSFYYYLMFLLHVVLPSRNSVMMIIQQRATLAFSSITMRQSLVYSMQIAARRSRARPIWLDCVDMDRF